jgi:hypothetical protein
MDVANLRYDLYPVINALPPFTKIHYLWIIYIFIYFIPYSLLWIVMSSRGKSCGTRGSSCWCSRWNPYPGFKWCSCSRYSRWYYLHYAHQRKFVQTITTSSTFKANPMRRYLSLTLSWIIWGVGCNNDRNVDTTPILDEHTLHDTFFAAPEGIFA